jgi:hypothetical protein
MEPCANKTVFVLAAMWLPALAVSQVSGVFPRN